MIIRRKTEARTLIMQNIPLQTNGFDCGVFTCMVSIISITRHNNNIAYHDCSMYVVKLQMYHSHFHRQLTSYVSLMCFIEYRPFPIEEQYSNTETEEEDDKGNY